MKSGVGVIVQCWLWMEFLALVLLRHLIQTFGRILILVVERKEFVMETVEICEQKHAFELHQK